MAKLRLGLCWFILCLNLGCTNRYHSEDGIFFLSRCNAQACLLVEYKNVLNDGCIDTD